MRGQEITSRLGLVSDGHTQISAGGEKRLDGHTQISAGSEKRLEVAPEGDEGQPGKRRERRGTC